MSYFPPAPTCMYCGTEWVNIDMAEDPDDPSSQWNTGDCPNADCDLFVGAL